MLFLVGIVAAFVGGLFGGDSALNASLTITRSDHSNKLEARGSRLTQGSLVQ